MHVDVFQFDPELEITLPNLLADFGQGLLNLLAFVGADQADGGQHASMGDRMLDVVRIEAAIEADALGEILYPRVGCFVEDASPKPF